MPSPRTPWIRSLGRCALGALVPLLVLSACNRLGSDDYIELPPLRPAPQPLVDAGVEIPDGATLCDRDEQCDDGIPCTRDVCASGTFCLNVPTASRCDDGVFCNGFEDCVAGQGCVAGLPTICEDSNICTIDRCDEARKACVHAPRDVDGDGEADWHCQGGTDCDDFDSSIRKGAGETCSDGRDNDCDGVIDEAACGRAAHDTCADALDVSAGGTYSFDLAGTQADYVLPCATRPTTDVVAYFELNEARDVHLVARGLYLNGAQDQAVLTLLSDCSEEAGSLECGTGFPGHVRVRALPKGTYYVLLDSPATPRVALTATFSSPSVAPENVSCEAATDLGTGQRIASDFVDVGDHFTSPCGVQPSEGTSPPSQADLVYRFSLSESSDVVLSAISQSGDPLTLSVRTECESASSTLVCARDEPAVVRMHSLSAGTYYVVVESPTYLEVDFELDFRVLPPTPPPPGDECVDPEVLATDGSAVIGSLSGKQGLVTTSCDQFAPDTVYRFNLTQPSDVLVSVASQNFAVGVALQTACGDPMAELACYLGLSSKRRFRNLAAGDYFLVLESYGARELTTAVERLPRTQPVAVTGNDRCQSAHDVPVAGGLFAGDTTGMANDYFACGNSRSADAVYRLQLDNPARVTVRTDATFDTILYRIDGSSQGAAACTGEYAACNDNASDAVLSESLLEEDLPAGVYYYIIDGYHVDSEGTYVVSFEVE